MAAFNWQAKKGTHLFSRRLELAVSMKIVASPLIFRQARQAGFAYLVIWSTLVLN
jgi:hypothetical protein